MSNLAIIAPGPRANTMRTASSTDVYFREHTSASMPSFTELPLGRERSRINRYFPGWCGLGITPKLLVVTDGSAATSSGAYHPLHPHLLGQVLVHYAGLSMADFMLALADSLEWLWYLKSQS